MTAQESDALYQDDELIEPCEVCGGPVDLNQPGYHKSPNEKFWHHLCAENGEPPEGYVKDVAAEYPELCSTNQQYQCGHLVFGPYFEQPDKCPECGMDAV